MSGRKKPLAGEGSVEKKTKGHWPKGKRRNQPLPQRQINGLMRRVKARITPGTRREGQSAKQTAREIGVSDRTLHRWLTGEDNPSAAHLVLIQAWLDGNQA